MKGLIVVVEGLERTGKTTLCKEFEKRGFVYFKDFNRINKHLCAGMESRLDTTLTFLQNLSENGVNVVVDRLHLSEYAYGKTFRKGYSANVNYIDNAISKLNSVLILCKFDNDVVNSLFEEIELFANKDNLYESNMLKFLVLDKS